jgi:hypothetical protein
LQQLRLYDRFGLGALATDGQHITFSFAYSDSGLSCTLSGTFEQRGQLLTFTATYQCSNGLSTTATVSVIRRRTSVSKRASPPNNAGCREDATFSAVFLPPI